MRRFWISWSVALTVCVGLVAATLPSSAQFNGCQAGFCQARAVVAAGYTGPGDIVTGAYAWYSCSRAYSSTDTANACNVCLPADALCADLTISGGFAVVPGSLSTCNVTSVICTIKTAYDKTGNGNHVTNATISARPTFRPAMASNGCPTSALPCMLFTQANSQFLLGPNTTEPQPITISFVYTRNTNGGEVINNLVDVLTNPGNIQLFAGSGSATATAADGAWHAAQTVFSGAASSIYVDGTSTGPVNPGTAAPTGNVITLGRIAVNNYFDGYLAEGGLWQADFSNIGSVDKRPAINSNQHSASFGYNF